jgi:hypothetical protein
MFQQVVVGIRDDQAGRDAIALAMELVSGDGAVTLPHVQVISARPAPDSGAVGAAAKYRYAIERLTTLASGLHEFASRQSSHLIATAGVTWRRHARGARGRAMRRGDRSRRIRLPRRQDKDDRRRLRPLG